MRRRRLVWACALGLATACEQPAADFSGGVAPLPSYFTPDPPAAPAPPELPHATCPANWTRDIDDAGAPSCAPWPESFDAGCADGFAWFPGGTACESVGEACPSGDWPSPLPSGALRFVQSGATQGNGTQSSPFGTIDAALTGASAGTTILVGAGNYVSAPQLGAQVTLMGVCAAKTKLTAPPQGSQMATVTATAGGTALRSMTIGGPGLAVLVRGTGVSMELSGVVIASAGQLGLYVGDGATATAHQLVVRDTHPRADGTFGRGIDVENNGTLTLDHAVLEHNADVGLNGYAASHLTVSSTSIHGTLARTSDHAHGNGIAVGPNVTLTLDGVVLDDNAEAGLYSTQSHVTATHLVVRGTRPSADQAGLGLLAEAGSNATLTETLLEHNRGYALQVRNPGSVLSATDLVVHDTFSDDMNDDGVALSIAFQGRIDVTRAVLARGRTAGALIDGASTAQLSDVIVLDTQSRGLDNTGGYALQVHGGATLSGARLLLAHNADGFMAVEANTNVTLDDVQIQDAFGQPNGVGGWGFISDVGSTVVVNRLAISNARVTGLLVAGAGTMLTASDVSVSQTLSDPMGNWGRGIYAQQGATVLLTRAHVVESRELGIGAYQSTVTGSQVLVETTLLPDCVPMGCDAFGAGVLAYDGTVSLDSFRVSFSDNCGVTVTQDGGISLHDGEISRNAIGVCVQTPNYDLTSLEQNVTLTNNAHPLDTVGTLPLPSLPTGNPVQ